MGKFDSQKKSGREGQQVSSDFVAWLCEGWGKDGKEESVRLAILVKGPLVGQSLKRWRRSSDTPKAYSAQREASAKSPSARESVRTLPAVDLIVCGQRDSLLEATVRVGSPSNVVAGDEHAKGTIEV